MSPSSNVVSLRIEREFSVPGARIFQAISDHEHLPDWLLPGATVSVRKLEKSSTIREIRKWFFVGQEEILLMEPPHRLHYRIVSGLPVRHHLARVSVESRGESACLLVWAVDYDSGVSLMNALVLWSIRRTIEGGLFRLARQITSE